MGHHEVKQWREMGKELLMEQVPGGEGGKVLLRKWAQEERHFLNLIRGKKGSEVVSIYDSHSSNTYEANSSLIMRRALISQEI